MDITCPEVAALQRDIPKKEKRKLKRDAISGSIAVLWGTNSQEERVSRANLIDISARGAQFHVTERIPPGSWLMFNHHKIGVSGRGTVRYCTLAKSTYRVGVEFSGGTGWNPASSRFSTDLQNLSIAIAD